MSKYVSGCGTSGEGRPGPASGSASVAGRAGADGTHDGGTRYAGPTDDGGAAVQGMGGRAQASPDRARQFLPFAALAGLEGCLQDAEDVALARGQDEFTGAEQVVFCDDGADAPDDDIRVCGAVPREDTGFSRKEDSRPWDLRLARILYHDQMRQAKGSTHDSDSEDKF